MRGPRVLLALVVPVTLISCSAWAQTPLPILRGVVLTTSGEDRAYFEDSQTRALSGYAIRDTVGDCRIEEIRADRVMLRCGEELIQMLLGASSADLAGGSDQGTPIIGNGQPWLDRLGIPPRAISSAIEQALPTQDSDNLGN